MKLQEFLKSDMVTFINEFSKKKSTFSNAAFEDETHHLLDGKAYQTEVSKALDSGSYHHLNDQFVSNLSGQSFLSPERLHFYIDVSELPASFGKRRVGSFYLPQQINFQSTENSPMGVGMSFQSPSSSYDLDANQLAAEKLKVEKLRIQEESLVHELEQLLLYLNHAIHSNNFAEAKEMYSHFRSRAASLEYHPSKKKYFYNQLHTIATRYHDVLSSPSGSSPLMFSKENSSSSTNNNNNVGNSVSNGASNNTPQAFDSAKSSPNNVLSSKSSAPNSSSLKSSLLPEAKTTSTSSKKDSAKEKELLFIEKLHNDLDELEQLLSQGLYDKCLPRYQKLREDVQKITFNLDQKNSLLRQLALIDDDILKRFSKKKDSASKATYSHKPSKKPSLHDMRKKELSIINKLDALLKALHSALDKKQYSQAKKYYEAIKHRATLLYYHPVKKLFFHKELVSIAKKFEKELGVQSPSKHLSVERLFAKPGEKEAKRAELHNVIVLGDDLHTLENLLKQHHFKQAIHLYLKVKKNAAVIVYHKKEQKFMYHQLRNIVQLYGKELQKQGVREDFVDLPNDPISSFNDLEKKRNELSLIVSLTDDLHKLQSYVKHQDRIKALSLYQKMNEEVGFIKFHVTHKSFFIEQLNSLHSMISFTHKKTEDYKKISSSHSLHGTHVSNPQDMNRYLIALRAIRKRDKVHALQLFLDLADKYPNNLAIKMHLQDALGL